MYPKEYPTCFLLETSWISFENFVNIHIEAAAESLPNKARVKYTVYWKLIALRVK